VFEFTGALVLGRVSTNTIAGGIADVTSFAREPEVYAYGMSCALWVGTVWLIITSILGLNVSSTHSISESILPIPLTSITINQMGDHTDDDEDDDVVANVVDDEAKIINMIILYTYCN
jgi:phosphate/sulfate permease